MKLEQGDVFERTYADWIRQHLPYYETLWQNFIGHDGRGQPLQLTDLSEAQERQRKKLYQAHYSAAIGCFQIDQTINEIEENLGKVTDIAGFLAEQRRLYCFICLVGNVRDMFKQMDEATNLKGDAYSPLQDFYALRSHILHSPRMPVKIDNDGLIQIPVIAKQNAKHHEWDDKSAWTDFQNADFVYLSEFCKQTRKEFFSVINEQHAKIYSAACNTFGIVYIKEPDIHDSVKYEETTSSFTTLSAIIEPSGSFITNK